MVRKTKAESEKTRASVLKAALVIFDEKGFAKASLEDIAAKAGVTRGAVYWHFKNKIDIFESLQEELHSSLLETIIKDLEKDHPAPLQQLEELCTNLLIDIQINPNKRLIMKTFFMKCDYSGDMKYLLEQQNSRKKKHQELFSRYFKRAQEKGHLNENAEPETLTLSLSCYLTGIVFEYIRAPENFNLEKLAPVLMKNFFAGFH